jgi:hypothetical protein
VIALRMKQCKKGNGGIPPLPSKEDERNEKATFPSQNIIYHIIFVK